MTLLMAATVIGLSGFHVYRAASQQNALTEHQMQGIARTLEQSSFPLTDSVLRQMKGLTGAEFVLVDPGGNIEATTRSIWSAADLPDPRVASGKAPDLLTDPRQIAGESYFHAAFPMRPRSSSSAENVLHIFYPHELFARQRRDAVFPTLVIGGLALVLVAGAATAIASRVARPLRNLGRQVAQMSAGDFQPMPLPPTRDEVQQLSVAVNNMAQMLVTYEATIRRTEQVRTLGQLGGALAHQLRNSATGARLALDIHRAECPHGDQSESLDVSRRQLILMEEYIQRFLTLGSRQSRQPERLDIVEVVNSLLPLVSPAASHASVQLTADLPEAAWMLGERDGLEHLILNLLLNAIEAAASTDIPQRRVRLALTNERRRLVLQVADNGPGPAGSIHASLFDSFVTTKPDGVGLGLAIARQVAADHRGTIAWHREGDTTVFQVELPVASGADTADARPSPVSGDTASTGPDAARIVEPTEGGRRAEVARN